MNDKNQCACQGCDCGAENKTEKVLIISWQRLVSDGGSTCPRCGSTEDELSKAVALLRSALSPLGIKVVLQKTELSLEEFKNNPSVSNTIFFNGTILEDLIEAKAGQSKCCDVCGDEECRTVDYGGVSYETIPADLLVRAGLIAGAKIH